MGALNPQNHSENTVCDVTASPQTELRPVFPELRNARVQCHLESDWARRVVERIGHLYAWNIVSPLVDDVFATSTAEPDLQCVEAKYVASFATGDNRVPVVAFAPHDPVLYEEQAFLRGAQEVITDMTPIWLVMNRLRWQILFQQAHRPRRIGSLYIDPSTPAVFWKGRRVVLRPYERQLVEVLTRRPGLPVTAAKLETTLGKRHQEISNDSLRTLVRRTRDQFRSVDPDFNRIENVPTIGYRWT